MSRGSGLVFVYWFATHLKHIDKYSLYEAGLYCRTLGLDCVN